MQITVVLRIIIGLAISAFLIVFLAVAAMVNQGRVKAELTDLTDRALPAVNQAYELALALQTANRAVTQHASIVDDVQLQLREQQYQQAVTLTQASITALDQALNFSPKHKQTLQNLAIDISAALDVGTQHIVTKNSLLTAQHRFSTNYANVLAQWNNYEADSKIIDRILVNLNNPANGEIGSPRTAGDGKYVQDRIPLARAVFNALPTLVTLEDVDAALEDMAKNASRVNTRMQRISEDNALLHEKFLPYVTLINDASVAETSVIHDYRQQLEWQFLSAQQLAALATQVNDVLAELTVMIEQLNAVADDSVANIDNTNQSARTTLVIVSALALVIASIVGMTTVLAIKKPLTQIMVALEQIASGDLTARLNVTRRDEFGRIALGIRSLVDSVKTIVSELKENAASVQRNTQEVTNVTQENSRLLDDQRTQSANVSVAAEELHQSAIQISDSAKDSSHRVDEVSRLLSQGNQKLDASVAAINALVQDLTDASGVVKTVEVESDNISKILEVIQGIAEQTNLLALNAAIEAARAGEQGRGFAVVADEVRNLASRTAQSTEEINAMISSLQASAAKAATIMASNLTRSDDVVTNTTETREAISQVSVEIHQIADISAQIAAGTSEQQENVTHVSHSIGLIADLSEQVSSRAHQNLTSFEQLMALTNKQTRLAEKFKTD
ncbi:MAG: methyl-accepting chemotaxis protein [Reinekea sp.]|nr:methyl-accepting chemotaxis protein [Reinekea sp.]